jgi:hypothetical protein
MTPVILTTFWEVVGWLAMAFFAVLFIWMFIAIFADIFHRRDLSGVMKALWIFLIFLLPLLGILLYVIFRPAPTQEEVRMMMASESRASAPPPSSTEEITKAHELLTSGVINQEEFEALKRKALATAA